MPQKSPMQYVVDAVEQIVIVDASQVTPGTHLKNDLSADSLDLIEIGMVIEESLAGEGIDISLHGIEVETVQDYVNAVINELEKHANRTDV